MGADARTRDLGKGHLLVVEHDADGYRASLSGFCGVGPTEEGALEDLLVRMRDYVKVSAAFSRSLAPGGELDKKLQQIGQLVDQIGEYRCTCLRRDEGFGAERHTHACARRNAEGREPR